MAARKIENVALVLPDERRRFRVLRSFDALAQGAEFEVSGDGPLAWARRHAEVGYLQDLTEEAPDAGEGDGG